MESPTSRRITGVHLSPSTTPPPRRPPKSPSRTVSFNSPTSDASGSSPTGTITRPRSSQSERTRQELQRLEEAKRVERLRASYNINTSRNTTSASSGHSRRNISVSLDSSSGGAHRGGGGEDEASTSSHAVDTLNSNALPEPAPSPDSVLASVLANMSLRDSPSTSTTLMADQVASPTSAKSKRRSFLKALGASGSGSSSSNNLSPKVLITSAQHTNVCGIDATPTPAVKPISTATARRASSKDDLALLVISSGITELSMSIQEVNTIIFEIQELRHSTAAIISSSLDSSVSSSASSDAIRPYRPRQASDQTDSSASGGDPDELHSHEAASLATSVSSLDLNAANPTSKTEASALSEVDAALMRLQERLESLVKEYTELEQQILPFLKDGEPTGSASFLPRKWQTAVSEYEAAQRDADMLGEELKEDKWLVVFRTVSSQAEDMMRSLEKVLSQSHQFVWDLDQRRAALATPHASSSASSSAGSVSSSPSRGGRMGLSKSTSSSAPSFGNTYFGDPETMQPLLTSFVALHRSLHSKVKYYAPACDRVLKILGKGIADRSTKNGEVLRRFAEMKTRWRNLVERISRIEAEMKGVEELLREAAGPLPGADSPATTPKKEIDPKYKAESPLRKWANKVTGTTRQSPVASKPPVSNRTAASANANVRTTTPVRPATSTDLYSPPQLPPKSPNRTLSRRGVPLPSPISPPPRAASRSNLLTPPPRTLGTLGTLPHRRTASTSTLAPFPPTDRTRGVHSPSMSVDTIAPAEKPRWNSSTKRLEQTEALALAYGRAPSRTGTPRSASAMAARPPSRLVSGRPTSPTYSDASSNMTGARPGTPSRIPVLTSRRSSINPSSFADEADHQHTSMMQRVISPTPSSTSSSARALLSRSTPTSGRMQNPGGLSPPRATSPTGSSYSSRSAAAAARRAAQTPELHLMAQAHRMAHVRAPRPPPVPVVPRNLRTPTGSYSGGGSGGALGGSHHQRPSLGGPARPGSSLGRSVMSYGSEFSDDELEEDAETVVAGRYPPNPIDALDTCVAKTINALPIQLHVQRIDPALTRAQVAQMEVLQAKYVFALSKARREVARRRPVVCKLVDRLGPRVGRGEKKVVVRLGVGWQDLDAYGMGLLAQSV